MKKEFYQKLIDRAVQFFKDALYDASFQKYDVAMVHLEQALQLLLKAKIFERDGEFPVTHSIKMLLRNLGEEKMIEKHRAEINMLEAAYLAGRYYDVDYEKEDFEMVLKFVKEVFRKYGIELDER